MRVAVFAGVSLNLIDGSSVWLASVVRVLSEVLAAEVVLISRDRIRRDLLVREFRGNNRITIIEPPLKPGSSEASTFSPAALAQLLVQLDGQRAFDLLVVRGTAWCRALTELPRFRTRICSYVLDPVHLSNDTQWPELEFVIRHSHRLLVQSEAQREAYVRRFPYALDKIEVLPPMVPSMGHISIPHPIKNHGRVTLAYSGKFAKLWNVETYFDLPLLGDEAGLSISVVMIGDKIHNEPSDLQFRERIRRKLKRTPGVMWAGAVPRQRAMELSARCDFGLCVRDEMVRYLKAFHISTKFLEFCSIAVPPIVNRHEIYESLLGRDYPFYADDEAGIIACVKKGIDNAFLYETAQRQCLDIGRRFSFEQSALRFRNMVPEKPHSGMDGVPSA